MGGSLHRPPMGWGWFIPVALAPRPMSILWSRNGGSTPGALGGTVQALPGQEAQHKSHKPQRDLFYFFFPLSVLLAINHRE